jgi:hypothetical protein
MEPFAIVIDLGLFISSMLSCPSTISTDQSYHPCTPKELFYQLLQYVT